MLVCIHIDRADPCFKRGRAHTHKHTAILKGVSKGTDFSEKGILNDKVAVGSLSISTSSRSTVAMGPMSIVVGTSRCLTSYFSNT